MKKIFVNPTAEVISVEMEDNILGASVVTGKDATKDLNNDNQGSGLARQNSTSNGSNPINVEALDF